MSTLFRKIRNGLTSHGSTRQRRRRLVIEALDQRCMLDAGIGYIQTTLASDVQGLAPNVNPGLQNPWGFSATPDGQFRVSANASGLSPLLDASGRSIGKPVIIPTPSDDPQGSVATPNGNLANTTDDFVISHDGKSAPATVLFSTEDGTIVGWNSSVDKREGVIGADLSDSGAVFKLLAAGSVNGANYLYATDFHNGKVDVFDKNFDLVQLSGGSFNDPSLPAGFAPFGVKVIGDTLFVTYAKQDVDRHDDVEGEGNGFINEFTLDGRFIERFASQGTLNSPIGMAVAPDNFGQFSNALLVGNFGDSRVNAFNMKTGAYLGQLTDAQGQPLVLNGGFHETDLKGLWGIGFGNGQGGTAANTLYFAAGINAESDGLFGKVTVNGENFGNHGVVRKAPHFYEDYVGPKSAQLNAVETVGELLPNGSFEFIGVNQGVINPNVQATYVFGIDRNGKLPPGPFPGRPDIRFDALVIVKLVPGQSPTASVRDLATGKVTSLSAGSLLIAGRLVAVNVPGSALPSTGLAPSQYRFNYWPEDGLPGSTHIASFAPEFNDAQIGVIDAGFGRGFETVPAHRHGLRG